MPAGPCRRGAEQGAGVVGTVIGVLIFLVMVLFATQVLFGLYTTSVVTAATYDAAKAVAGADTGAGAEARSDAEANARRQLGRFGDEVDFDWALGTDTVRLTVRARRPTLLPRTLVSGVGLADVERTVQVRSEQVR